MKRDVVYLIIALILLAVMLLSTSCCPCRNIGMEDVANRRDSIYIIRRDTVRIIEVDTMWLDRLEQSHDLIMTHRQHSELDNAYCTSTADIGEDGMLVHSLDTRDSAMLPARLITTEHIVRDTVVIERTAERTVREVQEKIVYKTAWYDKFLRLVSTALLAIVLWQNRKRIMTIIGLWRI